MNPTPTKTLPARAFDCGTETAAPDVASVITAVYATAKAHGLDVQSLCQQTKTVDAQHAPQLMRELHDATSLIFLQWQHAIQQKQQVEALAYARIVNSLTYDARFLHERFDLIDRRHLEQLAQNIRDHFSCDAFEATKLGEFLNEAAREHTHERAWPWVVLPTFARQPYGRILLIKVDIPDFPHPVMITQPFFLPGQSTLFHTHGQNWAYSRPLGNGQDGNTHINTLWMPKQADDPFPLDLIDNADYCSNEVAILPPKLIHGIARKRCWRDAIPSLSELLSNDSLKAEWLTKNRFGELACMHMYSPCTTLSEQLKASPFVQENEKFFIEYDMIVFDHLGESIWSGGGGSWPRRMIEYGTTGDHCGICFEEDARKENLDPVQIAKWFIQDPPPALIKLGFETAV